MKRKIPNFCLRLTRNAFRNQGFAMGQPSPLPGVCDKLQGISKTPAYNDTSTLLSLLLLLLLHSIYAA
jgi:hypothetical protein